MKTTKAVRLSDNFVGVEINTIQGNESSRHKQSDFHGD